MALIRLQDKVPPVYVEDSRDFQLFCRLYDVIINGLKYDVDGVKHVINTEYCKSTILQLLQTKLGFFTDKHFTDETIRYVLSCFALLVRQKGMEEGIRETVYMFLKINGVETSIDVAVINGTPTKAQKHKYGSQITDHSIVIGIASSVRDTTILYEVLRYIIPFGYNLFFYFFVGISSTMIAYEKEKAKIIYVSNDINSPLTGSEPPAEEFKTGGTLAEYWNDGQTASEVKGYKTTLLKDYINAVNTTEIIPQNEITSSSSTVRPVVQPGYEKQLKFYTESDRFDIIVYPPDGTDSEGNVYGIAFSNQTDLETKTYTIPTFKSTGFTLPEGKKFKTWVMNSTDGKEIAPSTVITPTDDILLYPVLIDE